MESTVYAVEAQIEESHWWFKGRRRLFADTLDHAHIAREAEVLDIGSSTGTNLRLLKSLGFSRVTGLDQSEEAIRYCAEKGLGEVRRGDACALPFPDKSFDLVLATDIIEHVEDDEQALREIARVLKPGGRVLLSVPAFPSLWGLQDRVAQHKRRYLSPVLRALVEQSGLEVRDWFYFNYLLFAPIWLSRRLIDALGIKLKSEGEINTRFLNNVLAAIFLCDILTAPRLRPPFGVSILMVATK